METNSFHLLDCVSFFGIYNQKCDASQILKTVKGDEAMLKFEEVEVPAIVATNACNNC